MTIIKDGTGNGYLARVDSENLLEGHVVTTDEYVHQSISHGDAYRILGTTTITAGVEKTVLIIVNNGDDLVSIDRVTTSIQGQSGQPANIRIYIGKATVTAGGSSSSPINVNITSANILNITGTSNSPTIGGTDTKILDIYIESTSVDRELINGGVVMGRGNSTRISCEGSLGTTGTMKCNTHILISKVEKTFHNLI